MTAGSARRVCARGGSAWRRSPRCSASCGAKVMAYGRVTSRAGEYAADWTMDGLSGFGARVCGPAAAPSRPLALGVLRDLVRETYGGSRAIVRMRRGGATVDIRSSIFCGVREPVPAPLCGFYEAAFLRVLASCDLPAVDSRSTSCRGTGSTGCFVAITLSTAEAIRASQPWCRTRRPNLQHDHVAVARVVLVFALSVLAGRRRRARRRADRCRSACSSCRSRRARRAYLVARRRIVGAAADDLRRSA